MEFTKALFILVSSFTTCASGKDVESDTSSQGDRQLRGAGDFDNASNTVKSPQRKAKKGLQTDGVCWTHSEGSICKADGNFKGVTTSDDEILIQELSSDGKLYSYKMQNEEKFRKDLSKVPADVANKKLAHVLAKIKQPKTGKAVKYGCTVEDVSEEEFSINDGTTELEATNIFGTSRWSVNGWIVVADSDMNPISIEIPNDEGVSEFSTSITSVDKFSTKDLEGCDPETEGNEYSTPSAEDVETYFELVNAQNPSISDDEFTNQGHRHLDWITDFSASASNTQWCGPGTSMSSTGCPNTGYSYDFYADNACRRHDHGEKIVYNGIGIPRLECAVDYDLKSATSNWAVQAVYGDWGGTQLPGFGCLNYQSYNCWKSTRWCGWACPTYGYCGMEWATRIGPWRYDGASRTSGYEVRSRTCPEDYRLNYW